MKTKAIILLMLLISLPALWAGDSPPVKLGPKDKCPVCGMFVAKYPDWVAVLTFKEGTRVFFDGVKDMLKYYFNMAKYAPGKTAADVKAVHVTDYYRLEPIDGRNAFYAAGSDVYGPMGKELIPFEKKGQAEEFLKDHRGERIITFEGIMPEVIRGLD